MLVERAKFGAAAVNGKIYVYGGRNSSGILDSVDEFDPVTNSWKQVSTMPLAKYWFATVVLNNKIYIIAGLTPNGKSNTVEVYDPIANSWSNSTQLPFGRYRLNATVANGKIYTLNGSSTQTEYSTDTMEFDTQTEVWTNKALCYPASMGVGVEQVNDIVYRFSGCSSFRYELGMDYPVVMAYDPIQNIWVNKTKLTASKMAMGLTSFKERIYLFSGGIVTYVSGKHVNKMYTTVEAYNAATNSWETKEPLTTARAFPCSVELNGKIYVIGGQHILWYEGEEQFWYKADSKVTYYKTMEIYNP